MDNKVKIGYEETDRKLVVNIYGIDFEIKNVSEELINKFNEINKEKANDFNELYKYVDLFLGENASVKINEQRKKDGYPSMDINVMISILSLVIKVIRQDIENKSKMVTNNNYNREYRRNNKYNRGRRRY